MTIITTFKIEKRYFNLENNIIKLKLLHDSLTFHIVIYDTIKLLESTSQLTKNTNNSYGKNFYFQ